MKKIITTIVMAFTVMAIAHAQNAEIRIKAREAEIPVVVVESYKNDFKGTTNDEWMIVPAALIGEEYVVTGFDNLDGAKPTLYTVTIKGNNVKGEAVYDQEGKLLHFKEVIKDTALPASVRNAVVTKYPGYTFIKNQETIKEGKNNFIHYKVVIENGKEKIALAVDASGKILKERKVRI